MLASQVTNNHYLERLGLVDLPIEQEFSGGSVGPDHQGVIHPGPWSGIPVLVPIPTLTALVSYPSRFGVERDITPGSKGLRTVGRIVERN
jgi:hypothetical protein